MSDFQNKYQKLLVENAQFICIAQVRGVLFDLGEYPGVKLISDLDNWVEGELYQLNPLSTQTILNQLDWYEGEEYKRVVADVLGGEALTQAWVYELTQKPCLYQKISCNSYKTYIKLK